MSLAAKLAEIYREVQRFEKTKAVTGQGPSYKYAPVEEIADALRVEMGKRGIVMVPSGAEVVASEDAGTTKSGTTRWRHIIRVTWTLTDGTDSLTVESIGEAMDTGDKGMNKAQTAARKYALIGAFQLSTGDDPDSADPPPAEYRRPAPRSASPTADERARELLSVVGAEGKAELVTRMKAAGISSSDLGDPDTYRRARGIAEGIAALNAVGAPSGRDFDPDRGEEPDPAMAGQATLGSEL